ncbi:ribonuclease HII [bacterium]|nr:ribonuclease HII [bacterium]
MDYPNFEYEFELLDKGFTPCGIDDCGLGSLAGDIVTCAVVVPENAVSLLEGKVRDSKKLSKKVRSRLNTLILELCECSIYSVSNEIVDEINVLEANKLCMYNSISGLSKCDYALIDGCINFRDLLNVPYKTLVKGDNKSISIACASIVAKEYRDAEMTRLAKEYPYYSFDSNMGYGSQSHRDAIRKYGPCPIHRRSYKCVKEYC